MLDNLPEIKKDMHEIEMLAKPSVDVLVKIKGITNIVIGRYYHGAAFWQADSISGQVEVEEWWPLPEIGSGTNV